MRRRYNWLCAIVTGFGSALYGYDAIVIASTFAQQGFLTTFKPDATLLGVFVSVYFAGIIIGLPITSYCNDRFGRKRSIQLGAFIGIVAGIMQSAPTQVGAFIVGRILGGMASGISLLSVNVYQAEIAPADVRGTMVGFQFFTLCAAGTLGAWMGYACSFSSSTEFAWRFPLAFQVAPALGSFVGMFFVPFSPRWLISKGRHDEARLILKRLHDDHEDHLMWEKEYRQISMQLEVERQEQENSSWHHLLSNRSERRRVLLAVLIVTCVQTCGAQSIQQYQSVLYLGLGYELKMILLMTGVFQICLTVGSVANLLLVDRLGRRMLLLGGLSLLTVLLAIFAACTERYGATGSTAWARGAVAVLMIFIFVFGLCIIGTPYVYVAEILPTKIRAKGLCVGVLAANLCSVTFSQTTPMAFEAISWKYSFIFMACNAVVLPLLYFYMPETKALTLEEVNLAFGEKVEVRLVDITLDDSESNKMAVSVFQKEQVRDA